MHAVIDKIGNGTNVTFVSCQDELSIRQGDTPYRNWMRANYGELLSVLYNNLILTTGRIPHSMPLEVWHRFSEHGRSVGFSLHQDGQLATLVNKGGDFPRLGELIDGGTGYRNYSEILSSQEDLCGCNKLQLSNHEFKVSEDIQNTAVEILGRPTYLPLPIKTTPIPYIEEYVKGALQT